MNTKQQDEAIDGELVEHEETALAPQPGSFSLVGAADRTDAIVALERAISWQNVARKALLRISDPADWVAQKTEPPTLMLCSSGAVKFAPFLGIKLSPVPPETDLTPVEVQEDGVKAWTKRALLTAERFGIYEREIEATRRSDEDFTGRSLDAGGAFTRKSDQRVKSYSADVRNSVRTLLITKAVRECGFKRVPAAEVAAAWDGTDKKLAMIQGGHGAGSAQDRRAAGVAEGDVAAEAKKLGDEILRRTGGDQNAARDLLVEITRNKEGKYGKTSCSQFTKPEQVGWAWEKLRKHPIFGDAKVPAAPTEDAPTENGDRQPGED